MVDFFESADVTPLNSSHGDTSNYTVFKNTRNRREDPPLVVSTKDKVAQSVGKKSISLDINASQWIFFILL